MLNKLKEKFADFISTRHIEYMDSIPEDDRPAHEIFVAKVDKEIYNGKKYGNHLDIGVYYVDTEGNETRIGSYRRNYNVMYDTFYAFKFNDKYYALYSKDYTATRIMELPSCKDIADEEEHASGFCPVEFYVPANPNNKDENLPFGFVAGCVWGDDFSWNIRYINLEEALEGDIKVTSEFGYVWLIGKDKLKDAIDCDVSDPEDWDENEGFEIHMKVGTSFYLYKEDED
jgi:hypothetical protein